MTRYIEADALYERLLFKRKTDNSGNKQSGLNCAIAQLKKAPTADVVEVVRCRDCKYRYDDLCPMYYVEEISWDDDGWTETDHVVHDLTNDDAFCSYGERRKEDGTSF